MPVIDAAGGIAGHARAEVALAAFFEEVAHLGLINSTLLMIMPINHILSSNHQIGLIYVILDPVFVLFIYLISFFSCKLLIFDQCMRKKVHDSLISFIELVETTLEDIVFHLNLFHRADNIKFPM